MKLLSVPFYTNLICLHLGFKDTEELKNSKFYIYNDDNWGIYKVDDSYSYTARVDDGNKICLVNITKENDIQFFYQNDFYSLLEEGSIVLFDKTKIEHEKIKVPFVNGLYIVHDFNVLRKNY